MIQLESLSLQVGDFTLDGVDMHVETGEYAVLMGATGSGKTTLLEAICGLRRVTAGSLVIGERDVTGLRPAERNIGLVPQDGALFPHLTVFEHLAFGLRLRRWSRERIEERVDELADRLQITALLPRRPRGLSGGERQRVALGRALAWHAPVLCLDEPLSALDEDTRAGMLEILHDLRRTAGVTVLHVSHRLDEAERLAHRVFRLRWGRVTEIEWQIPEESAP